MTASITHPAPVELASGTEKQRHWAESIREQALKEIREKYEPTFQAAIEQGGLTPEQETAIRAYNRAYARLARQSNAAWWIDNRIRATGSLWNKFVADAMKEQQ